MQQAHTRETFTWHLELNVYSKGSKMAALIRRISNETRNPTLCVQIEVLHTCNTPTAMREVSLGKRAKAELSQ